MGQCTFFPEGCTPNFENKKTQPSRRITVGLFAVRCRIGLARFLKCNSRALRRTTLAKSTHPVIGQSRVAAASWDGRSFPRNPSSFSPHPSAPPGNDPLGGDFLRARIQKLKPKPAAIARARRGSVRTSCPSKRALSAREKPIQPPAMAANNFMPSSSPIPLKLWFHRRCTALCAKVNSIKP